MSTVGRSASLRVTASKNAKRSCSLTDGSAIANGWNGISDSGSLRP